MLIIKTNSENIKITNSLNIFYALRLPYLIYAFKPIKVDNLFYMSDLTKHIEADMKQKISKVEDIPNKKFKGITIVEVFGTKDKDIYDKLYEISNNFETLIVLIRASIKLYLQRPIYFRWRRYYSLFFNVFLVSVLRNNLIKLIKVEPFFKSHDLLLKKVEVIKSDR